ncbi:ABC transporter substrate-binding protein [Paraburkholderia sp. BCC1885]|jgi:branched-chain amino acid transport system substrate-binding protein|uniref:ABC transporter substrate-binding protein n=1 Tax=Paraburkholderia sp. BCC1885 TaxID=2562669 RepID=UPI00118212DA|nr:ABC transporter substrate-binding protein [Paraburkholderia sp. BCC1885]
MLSKRNLCWVIATATACFTIATHAAEPIKLGVSGPFTGGSAPMGISMRNGIKLAVDEINAAGGVLGRPLVMVERDDQANNARGLQIAQELVYKEHVAASVGIISTGVILASQKVYQDAQIPLLTPGPSGTQVTKVFMTPAYPKSYVFRVSLVDRIQAGMIANEAINREHLTKVAVFADSSNYGQLGREDMTAALAKLNITPVDVEKWNQGDVDMTSQVLRAKTAGAQALLTYGEGPELAQIANEMVKLGWKVPMIGSWTLSMPNYIQLAGPNAEGTRFPQTFVADGSPRRQAFLEKYEKAYHTNYIPGAVWAAQGYDVVYLMAAAMKQAGTTDGPQVRDALENLNTKIDGLIMTYDHPFSKTDHDAIRDGSVAVMAEIKGGHVVKMDEAQAQAAR